MAKIKAKKMDVYEPYSFRDTVYLDCPECGEEFEWVDPFTVCAVDYSDDYDIMRTCRMYSATPQRRCIKCQVKLRLKQAEEKHES